jgi:hypothetical protein
MYHALEPVQPFCLLRPTVYERTRIVAAFRPFWPPKRARCSEFVHEIPLSGQVVSQVGAIPGLIGGSGLPEALC